MHVCAWQMVVPTSDMDTLAKVDVSAFNVTTYAAAFSKQVRLSCVSLLARWCQVLPCIAIHEAGLAHRTM